MGTDAPDPQRLVAFLRERLDSDDGDEEGWLELDQLGRDASRAFQVEVRVDHIVACVGQVGRVELAGTRVRVVRSRPTLVPDILFHATTAHGVERVRRSGMLAFGGGRRLFVSADEGAAWRAAHRLDGAPRLLVVDTARARRAGVRFVRTRLPGLYACPGVPARFLLNLRDGYAEQWSAGGLPVRRFQDGVVRVALVQVLRRSGATWEIAKGKLEPGEPPERAAVREIQEEMGISVPFRVLRHVGDVRYGFVAPGDEPRLKTIFFYLVEPTEPITAFAPRADEGIAQVGWFTMDEALRAITHTSLVPVMARARDLLVEYGTTPAPEFAVARSEGA